MIKRIQRLLVMLILLSPILRVPSTHAEGGLVFRPYWTFRTDAPVTHLETGDIDGDGVTELVVVTDDNLVHILENDGSLAWRYDAGSSVGTINVADLDGNGTQETWIHLQDGTTVLLGDKPNPICTVSGHFNTLLATTVSDLDGDGRPELLLGGDGRTGFPTDTPCGFRWWQPLEQPVIDIWVGDVDGDGRVDVVPNPAGGNSVYVLQDRNRLLWRKPIAGEVGLVQGGDVDGDGLAEVVVLSTSQDLFLLDGDGRQVWQNQTLSVENVLANPLPGQLVVHDLDGDGQAEIVVVSVAPSVAVNVFDGAGRQIWRHPLDVVPTTAKLTVEDVNGDGQAEVVVTALGQPQVYLLSADGQRLAEYRPAGTIGAIAHEDLNNDGWGEVIVGTEAGVEVYGSSAHIVRGDLWQSPRLLGSVYSLYIEDVDGDSRSEVIAGSDGGRVYVLGDKGHVLWDVGVGASVMALSAGDVDGDGRNEVAVGTFGDLERLGRNQIHLLDGDQQVWEVPVGGGFINSLDVRDLDGDDQAEIIAGTALGSRGAVLALDSTGNLIWKHELGERVTAVGDDGGQVLAGTERGRVYRLTTSGSEVKVYDLGASRVLSLADGLAATADGRVYRLGENGPNLAYEIGQSLSKAQVSAGPAIINTEGAVSLVTSDGVVWQEVLDGRGISLATGDVNGDGDTEIAVGTDQGGVHLFGLALDQPPMLTKPDIAETRTGYAYSVSVNDPEGDAVPVTLEIWDPSAGQWLAQPSQSLVPGQNQGRLDWQVPAPFDMWDSGQESRFRFSFSNGGIQGELKEIVGPLTIPTPPWYVYYGQRAGLGALILTIPALALLLYRRQHAYRRSPVGQAEALLKELQANPGEELCVLHDLARDDPAQLALLSGLASEAGETTIADLSEGFHLILTRPEVTPEGLRAISGALESLNGSCRERTRTVTDLYDLSQRMLGANTVSRIVGLRPQLSEVAQAAAQPDSDLGEVAEALVDLDRVADALRNYQRVDLVEDKTAYLAQAIETLGRLDREFQARLAQPERNVQSQVALRWLAVSTNTLQDLQGRAQLEVSLKTRQLVNLDGAALSLELANTGRSPASNVVVTLLPGQGYSARNGDTAQLDILPAGRSVVVELPVPATAAVDRFRAEFSITFDDRERGGKRLAFADVVHLLQPAAEFQPVPNPYVPGTPLSPGSPVFFGRDDLFEFIEENIAGLARQNILVLIGERRMGKTSFLQQLPARLGDDYLLVYLDGQSLGIDPGMANFFYDLALAIFDALADQGAVMEQPQLEEFQARPSGAFERTFLPAVFEAIGEQRLLLLFDEFEELEMRVASGKMESTIFPFLRHLMQHERRLGLTFVGTHRLEALSSDYWSIFFNIALYKHVTFLSKDAARELIVKPVAEYGLLYDELAVDKMLRLTAGHPYFLQLICHTLVNHANRERRGYLTIRDVNDVLNGMLELGEAHFAFLWEQSSPSERWVLASLSQLLGREPTVTAGQIAELLAERGVAPEIREVTEALRRLTERGIVREVGGQPPRYGYKVELVQLWVERYKALGRVVEEVE